MKERAAIRKMLREEPESAALLLKLIESGKLIAYDDPTADIEEPLTLVCSADSAGIDGSRQDRCKECSAVVWLSPSTQEMIVKRGQSPQRIICPQCWVKELKKDAQAG